MNRRRFMTSGGGGGTSDMFLHIEKVGTWNEPIDTGLKMFSDAVPEWTIFTHQDVKPSENKGQSATLWKMWQNDTWDIKENGMDCISPGSFANDWSRGYGVRVRDKYNNYEKTFNNGKGIVESVWKGDCFWFSPLNVAVKKNSSGYWVSLNGNDWTFLMQNFPNPELVLEVGSDVYSEGTTELCIWLNGDVDLTEYFNKYK